MSEKKRKFHSPEFKAKVGLEALQGLKTINEIGQEYGVHPVQVGQWKKAIQADAKQLFQGKRGPKPAVEHQQPERLYVSAPKAAPVFPIRLASHLYLHLFSRVLDYECKGTCTGLASNYQ